MIKKILVTTDFSDLSTDITSQAADLARVYKAEVFVVHVIPPSPVYSGSEISPPVILDYSAEEWHREQRDLDAIVDFLVKKGINASNILVSGPIASTIYDKAIQLDVDLIIVGAHSHGFLYRAFIGSVSEELLKDPPCPIMVIPGNT
jgi:nucleotide-binding universal stress UspA family protein